MKGRIRFGLLTLMALAVATGCAPTNVTQQSTDMTAKQLAKPTLVLVYDFAVSPDEVKLDTGLSAGSGPSGALAIRTATARIS